MAVQQNKKGTTLADAYSFKQYDDHEVRAAALVVVKPNGILDIDKNISKFLINPSSWSESKSTNWVQQNVPGNSDPIMQWVSGGARVVTFSALVTADTSRFVAGTTTANSAEPSTLDKAASYFGGIAAAFSKVNVPNPRVPSGEKSSDLDISSYLNYYRSLIYPVYDDPNNPKKLTQSPPLVVLFAGNAITRYPYGNRITTKHDVWVVTNLEINITKQLPNLAPMEATVNFQLTQYNIKSFGRERFFPDRT